ncbi:hypothetical protein NT07LI_2078a, partial [Listeria innocua FSL S4-378]
LLKNSFCVSSVVPSSISPPLIILFAKRPKTPFRLFRAKTHKKRK